MKGRFGEYGGQYIPETLMNAVIELENAYEMYKEDEGFQQELQSLLVNYAGRPSLLYQAEKMTKDLGGAKIYLKREDLNHTGSHKINNVLGQVLLAKKMGKAKLLPKQAQAAWCCYRYGCSTAGARMQNIYGSEDMGQALNVYRMELLGAEVQCGNLRHANFEGCIE